MRSRMSGNDPSRAFGRISAPRQEWLSRAEPEQILDPSMPIVDSHHYLWDSPGRYLLGDFLADTDSGHNVVASVLVECGYKNRTDGPVELSPTDKLLRRTRSSTCAARTPIRYADSDWDRDWDRSCRLKSVQPQRARSRMCCSRREALAQRVRP